MAKQGFTVFNYSDDVIGIHDSYETALAAYKYLLNILECLGLPVSKRKLEPPAKAIVCLGIHIDVANSIVSIPEDKLQDFYDLCVTWHSKVKATKLSYNRWLVRFYMLVNVFAQLDFSSIEFFLL